jgi:hypothetical protein
MKRIGALFSVLACFSAAPQGAQAEPDPIVIELFTSQGCSSCPSADALLAKLATRDDVLALSLHVDYWDYIGWPDEFAMPQFTKRQKGYARAMGERMIYTPQMILEGQTHVVGNRPMDVADALMRVGETRGGSDMTASLAGDQLTVSVYQMPAAKEPMLLQLVAYTPSETVKIGRGENAGKEVTYVNVVTSWQVLTEWDGQGTLTMTLPETPADQPLALILQHPRQGAIEAAALLR